MSRKAEYYLQANVCDYLRLQYPDVLFQSDLSGIKLPIGQAAQMKRIKYGKFWPDLFLAEPRGEYAGLFLELKTDEDEIYTRRGELRRIEHIQGQLDMLLRLRNKGYKAEFVCGFDEAKAEIDKYLNLKAG